MVAHGMQRQRQRVAAKRRWGRRRLLHTDRLTRSRLCLGDDHRLGCRFMAGHRRLQDLLRYLGRLFSARRCISTALRWVHAHLRHVHGPGLVGGLVGGLDELGHAVIQQLVLRLER